MESDISSGAGFPLDMKRFKTGKKNVIKSKPGREQLYRKQEGG